MQSVDDPAIAAILAQAAEAYDAGDLARFDELLGQAAQSDLAGIERDRARLVRASDARRQHHRPARAAGVFRQRLSPHRGTLPASGAAAPESDPMRKTYSIGAAEALLNRANEFGEAEHMRDAVRAYREALANSPRATDPYGWAWVQMRLGDALKIIGQRGETEVLRESVAAYRAALEVYTPDRDTIIRRSVQQGLGSALKALGQRTGDAQALRDAVAAYRAALKSLPPLNRNPNIPVMWAELQTQIGDTMRALGRLTGDEQMVQEGTQALRAAFRRLEYSRRTRTAAIAQYNLGAALLDVGQGGDQQALRDAVALFRAALEVFTRENAPAFWASARAASARRCNHSAPKAISRRCPNPWWLYEPRLK